MEVKWVMGYGLFYAFHRIHRGVDARAESVPEMMFVGLGKRISGLRCDWDLLLGCCTGHVKVLWFFFFLMLLMGMCGLGWVGSIGGDSGGYGFHANRGRRKTALHCEGGEIVYGHTGLCEGACAMVL